MNVGVIDTCSCGRDPSDALQHLFALQSLESHESRRSKHSMEERRVDTHDMGEPVRG